MSRSLFLSIISGWLIGGCGGDDDCGPMGAPEFGLAASSDQVTLTFGDLEAGPNHDCPDPMSSVEPLTIAGVQMGGPGVVTFCIPRPDLLATQDLALGTEVLIIDLNGMDSMCSYTIDTTLPSTGTAHAEHECGNGTSKDGFALVVDGAVSLRRMCGATTDSTPVTLRGTVAVLPM